MLTGCGVEHTRQNEVAYETYPDISASAVHYDYAVSLEQTEEIEETTDDSSADNSGSYDDTDDVYAGLDVWDMGLEWYDISYLDTTRTLKLITYEGYGYSRLSYYVACCCWSRATEDYWGYGNLYSAFGEADTSYDTWMDELGIADYAYVALEQCYRDPIYCRYCNGMAVPYDYIYYENGIYVWN